MCAAGLGSLASGARAQAFPSKPVRIVVPFPPGSAGDVVARQLGRELQTAMGQPFLIDNKPGAQGVIGAEAVAKSPADGYTLLIAAISFASSVSEFKKLPYDVTRDFAPIAMVATLPLVLMVKPEFPARTPQEFIAHLKSRATPASAGYGSSSSRVCVAQLKAMAGVNVTEIAYKGIPLAVNDVLAGVIDFTFVDLGNALAQAKGGALRAIAIASDKRSSLAPDWPTLSEVLPGYDLSAWISLVAPAGTPTDAAQRLNEETARALAKPELRNSLAVAGMTPWTMGRDELGRYIVSEIDKWARLNKAAGILPQ